MAAEGADRKIDYIEFNVRDMSAQSSSTARPSPGRLRITGQTIVSLATAG